MRGFFARNLLFVLLVNVLVKPIWIFLIDRTVQNKVGHGAYGTYQSLVNLAVIFLILLDFGINNYNSRSLSHHPGKVTKLFPVMLSARLLLSGTYFLLVGGLGLFLGYSHGEMLLLFCLLGIQVMGSIIQLFRSTAAGLHQFKWDGILSVTDRLLMIVICGVMLVLPSLSYRFRIEWFVAALIASYGIAMITGFWIMRRIAGVGFSLSLHRARVANIMRRSLPYALLILMMSVYSRIDVVLLERMGGPTGKEHAGIFTTAYRLLEVGNTFGLLFANMLLPVLGRLLRQKSNVSSIIRLSINVLLPFSILAAVIGLLYARPIMDGLYTDTTSDNATVFTLMMLSFPAYSLSNVYSTLLTAAGKLRMLIMMAFVGVAVNMGLNLWLIPLDLSVGAGLAALATQWVMAFLFAAGALRVGDLKLRLGWLSLFAAYFLLVLAAAYGLQHLPLSWLSQCGLLIIISAVLVLAFRFVRPGEIKKIVQLKSASDVA